MTGKGEKLFPAVGLLVEAASAHPDSPRGRARSLRQRLLSILSRTLCFFRCRLARTDSKRPSA
jgi:hypothetical protein